MALKKFKQGTTPGGRKYTSQVDSSGKRTTSIRDANEWGSERYSVKTSTPKDAKSANRHKTVLGNSGVKTTVQEGKFKYLQPKKSSKKAPKKK